MTKHPKGFIYLATPYSHAESHIRERRYHEAAFYVGELSKAGSIATEAGYSIYSPVVASHTPARHSGLPTNAEFWNWHNKAMLDQCACLVICCLMSGWDKSQGIKWEVEYAKGIGKPIYYLERDRESDNSFIITESGPSTFGV